MRSPPCRSSIGCEAETKAAQIDDARIIVAGGRGVGGPDGFALIEDLAEALGGAVGATRAAVDSGWIPYSQQIGQTGKIVKPQLYLAMGISGAIQHKVGMQTASTIVAVNRDPDAPIADFADMIVIGDLVEVGNALLAELAGTVRADRCAYMTVAELTVLLPVAAFVALALGVVVVLRRAGRIVARTREVEHFRSSVRDLADADRPVARRRDRPHRCVRRGQLGGRHDRVRPSRPRPTRSPATPTRRAPSKGPPAGADPRRDRRGARARRTRAGHGRPRREDPAQVRRRGRELEAQTSIKRGYLNLVHAREAIVRHAAAAQELEVPPVEPAAKGRRPARRLGS